VPSSVKVVWNEHEIHVLLTSEQGPVARDLVRRGQRVLNAARRRAPVNTGALRGSLTSELITVSGAPAVRVGSNLPYAIYVHEGHGPIVPVRAKILRWPAINNSGAGRRRYRGGETAGYVFAHRVRAVAGRPFLLDALDEAAH
jgi:Bacteriophage HK97-gp10, putative tail-component